MFCMSESKKIFNQGSSAVFWCFVSVVNIVHYAEICETVGNKPLCAFCKSSHIQINMQRALVLNLYIFMSHYYCVALWPLSRASCLHKRKLLLRKHLQLMNSFPVQQGQAVTSAVFTPGINMRPGWSDQTQSTGVTAQATFGNCVCDIWLDCFLL